MSRRTCRTVSPSSAAARRCVTRDSIACRITTSRRNSFTLSTIRPSPLILPSWSGQGVYSRGHFYCGRSGQYHCGITDNRAVQSVGPERRDGYKEVLDRGIYACPLGAGNNRTQVCRNSSRSKGLLMMPLAPAERKASRLGGVVLSVITMI